MRQYDGARQYNETNVFPRVR